MFKTSKANTLTKIVGGFQKTLMQLDAFMAQNRTQAEAKIALLKPLRDEIDGHFAEIDRAQKIRSNIERLIEEPNG